MESGSPGALPLASNALASNALASNALAPGSLQRILLSIRMDWTNQMKTAVAATTQYVLAALLLTPLTALHAADQPGCAAAQYRPDHGG